MNSTYDTCPAQSPTYRKIDKVRDELRVRLMAEQEQIREEQVRARVRQEDTLVIKLLCREIDELKEQLVNYERQLSQILIWKEKK